jgi:multiple sugar transport system permease protein
MVVGEKKRPFGQMFRFLMILAVAVVTIYPLLWMVASSFKFENDIFQQLGLIPRSFTLENYREGWKGQGATFALYFRNSFALVLLATVGNLISCSLAAYAFARKEFKLKGLMFSLMLMTIMLPPHAVIIPQYIMFFKLGISNSMIPIVLPKFFAIESFFIFLLVQFMRGIPRELDQAAIVDGCGSWGIFRRIIIPLSQPALVTTTIFSFLWTWNDFFPQLIYLTTPKLFTVSLALKQFIGPDVLPAYGQMMAMSTLSIIPIMILFVLFQRLLIEGISTTGMKF